MLSNNSRKTLTEAGISFSVSTEIRSIHWNSRLCLHFYKRRPFCVPIIKCWALRCVCVQEIAVACYRYDTPIPLYRYRYYRTKMHDIVKNHSLLIFFFGNTYSTVLYTNCSASEKQHFIMNNLFSMPCIGKLINSKAYLDSESYIVVMRSRNSWSSNFFAEPVTV
jgi:hypothetical protein